MGMKKSDRLKPKKKRKYRFDHERAIALYHDKVWHAGMTTFAERLLRR